VSRKYSLYRKDFEVKDMFSNGYARTWCGLQDESALIQIIRDMFEHLFELRICQRGCLLAKKVNLQGWG
jgi:hypothetical protein